MEYTKEVGTPEIIDIIVEPELIIICKHCEKPIGQTKLLGFSLLCPFCGKPQNGQFHQEN